ncbi:hypothetical protein AX774_g628 [Zancudomyces culisetae]|uniref:Uncharacterized protein n=1 Tax=Zancudomyces culisetae TaxID=1213189 RepID=A0A1R1PXX4_ZANCU|nr:hypothetical protein AX774_g628 [Zancudomyces culisetae]|eukprot:OMH85820.1 hypothetical protein AX774_g628 [Zancudomyces culisetae]
MDVDMKEKVQEGGSESSFGTDRGYNGFSEETKLDEREYEEHMHENARRNSKSLSIEINPDFPNDEHPSCDTYHPEARSSESLSVRDSFSISSCLMSSPETKTPLPIEHGSLAVGTSTQTIHDKDAATLVDTLDSSSGNEARRTHKNILPRMGFSSNNEYETDGTITDDELVGLEPYTKLGECKPYSNYFTIKENLVGAGDSKHENYPRDSRAALSQEKNAKSFRSSYKLRKDCAYSPTPINRMQAGNLSNNYNRVHTHQNLEKYMTSSFNRADTTEEAYKNNDYPTSQAENSDATITDDELLEFSEEFVSSDRYPHAEYYPENNNDYNMYMDYLKWKKMHCTNQYQRQKLAQKVNQSLVYKAARGSFPTEEAFCRDIEQSFYHKVSTNNSPFGRKRFMASREKPLFLNSPPGPKYVHLRSSPSKYKISK